MARGFSGMKDDLMEIINHIIGLSCCSVAHDDNDGLLLPLPQPTVGDFACLEVSQVFSASDTEVRDAAGMEDVPRSDLTCTAHLDDGTGPSVPRAEYVVNDEGLDPGFAAVRNTLCPTFENEKNFWRGYNASLNIKLFEKDSEFLPSSQIEKEKNSNPKIIEKKSISRPLLNYMGGNDEVEEDQGTTKEISSESASDIEDYYIYSKKEGENLSLQKHILVEDHMTSISLSEGLQLRKRTNKNDEDIRDYHEADGFEYVIV